MDQRNPYVFVVGCPRSGTTLLQRMLDAHPALTMAYDSLFIPQVIHHVPDDVDPPLTRELVQAVRDFPRFPRLGLSDDAVQRAALARTYSGFVRGLYDELAESRGKPLAGEKSPGYVGHINRLHRLFPGARFVHLIRDGRDVALSMLDWARPDKGPGRHLMWDEDPLAVCALLWRERTGAGLRDGRPLGPECYHEVRYERLVSDPAEVLRTLAAFLDLPFSSDMLVFHRGHERDGYAASAKSAWLPPTPGLRDWRSQMSPAHVQLFEAIAGDMLADAGYERTLDEVPDETAAHAQACIERWLGGGRRKRPKTVYHTKM